MKPREYEYKRAYLAGYGECLQKCIELLLCELQNCNNKRLEQINELEKDLDRVREEYESKREAGQVKKEEAAL